MASYMDVLQQIKKQQISPVYLLYGTENYFIHHLKKQIKKALLPVEDVENVSTYDLREVPIQDVVRDAETYPFFGDKKLIIAENPVFLQTKPDKLPFSHDLAKLQTYLDNPVDYSVIMMIGYFEKIDERKKISKQLKKKGTIAECKPVKPSDLRQWLKHLADSMQVTIAQDAFVILEEKLSTDLYMVQNELDKLSLYVGKGGTITKDVVNSLVSHTMDGTALKLVDAVIERDLHEAILIYRDLAKMKEDPLALIGLLAFQFRNILHVKRLKQKGYSPVQMQKQLGVHPYVVKIAGNREKSFRLHELKNILNILTEKDSVIKQGKMDKHLAFEMLLYDLIYSIYK